MNEVNISQQKKQKRKQLATWLALGCICAIFVSCGNKHDVVKATCAYLNPIYGETKLVPISDTLHFPLTQNTYKRIQALNLFKVDSTTYLSFYDRGSKSLNIYEFYSGKLINRTSLYNWIKSRKLDKASVFVRNFDSIYVTTQSAFFLLDSTGLIKKKIDFPEEFDKWGYINNTEPLILKDKWAYLGIKPFFNDKSLKGQRKWKALYEFDMTNSERNLYYSLPDIYQNGLFGYAFLDYSYCVNDKGNFVFSFAADPNIYETNLSDYHIAHFGRSKFQKEEIQPVSIDVLKKMDGYEVYSLKDSYGAIFFDAYRRRYLRMAKQKMTEADFQSKVVRKKKSIIVLSEEFQIIGESELGSEFLFDFMLFADSGKIYARTNAADEHALHFVRLVYQESSKPQSQIASQHTNAK